ncbi:MAG TPA: hypothetical protein PK528_12410 [Syntrophorhabdus sp.]|nr:hypothetical protein [Syntrophorhabdus sp.]
MDTEKFIIDFQDYLAPRLDIYEQALYFYIFRHTRFIGLKEATIGFKSARTRMACGIGEKGKPMSENTAYLKLQSLADKGAITILRTEHSGRLIRLHLPNEIPNVIPTKSETSKQNLDEMDFFNVPENRLLILEREGRRCFYTLRDLDEKNFVIDHVVSRPTGNNGYRNVVAASREANNRKGSMPADDFIRKLYREGFLNHDEFEERLVQLSRLRAGELKPQLKNG